MREVAEKHTMRHAWLSCRNDTSKPFEIYVSFSCGRTPIWKLGTLNGIELGLNNHREVLEKPLILDKTALSDIASWLMSFVKAMNNSLFKIILDRSVDSKNSYFISWKWSFSKDKVKFSKLYNSFASTLDTVPSPSIEEIYGRFKASMKNRKRAKATK